MSELLKKLFDYQRFEGNSDLQELIDQAESKGAVRLSDDDLELVNAAGQLRARDYRVPGKNEDPLDDTPRALQR